MTPVEQRITSMLAKVKRIGEGRYMACCPAHDDREPSLSLYFAPDGRVLLRCFSGCVFSAIVEAMGLAAADFFPQRLTRLYLPGGDDHRKARREEKRQEPYILILDMCDHARAQGKRLTPEELQREREAWLRVNRPKGA